MNYVSRFVDWLFESWGITQPTLVATLEEVIVWYDDVDDDDGVDEVITFYLIEYPSGRRDYRVHVYGENDAKDIHEIYTAQVMAWVYGGPLPERAKRPNSSPEIIKLVKDTPPEGKA